MLPRHGIFRIVALVSFSPSLLLAQNHAVRFEYLTVDQGLSQNTVLHIFHDSQGFMWFGTLDGLNRFDGHELRVYRHDPLDSLSLPQSFISGILEDSAGTLWIATSGGLASLPKASRAQSKFVRHNAEDIGPIVQNRLGQLWAGSKKGLLRLDKDGNVLARFVHEAGNSNSLVHDAIHALSFETDSTLWIGTMFGLARLEVSSNHPLTFTNFRVKQSNFLTVDHVRLLQGSPSGDLWVLCNDGRITWLRRNEAGHWQTRNPNENFLDRQAQLHGGAIALYQDREARLWCVFNDGSLGRYALSGSAAEELALFTPNPADKSALNGDIIRTIYQDRYGTYWAGLQSSGIARFNLEDIQFEHHRHHPAGEQNALHDRIWTFHPHSDEEMWIGTSQGLSRFLLSEQQPPHLQPFAPQEPLASLTAKRRVRAIHHDRFGTTWIATLEGLIKLEGKAQRFSEYDPANPASLPNTNFYAIYEDADSTIWLGCNGNGLIALFPRDRMREKFTHVGVLEDSLGLQFPWVIEIRGDSTGTMWLATWADGLIRYHPQTRELQQFKYDPANAYSLSSNSVFCTYQDAAGDLWVGTNGGGLCRAAFVKDGVVIFDRFTKNEGLPNDVVYAILEDDFGFLWLSTNHGLSRFDKRERIFKNYDLKDGLQSNEFNLGAAFKDRSGRLYFGGPNGFNRFSPKDLRNPQPPDLVLTGFRRQGEEIRFEAGAADNAVIELSHEVDFFAFEFAALHYKNPQKNRYAYKIEGFNDDWVDNGSRREATYTNLDPGEYTFRVKAANSDGVWNEQGLAIKVLIHPPWWQTWPAYLSYLILFAAALWTLRRYDLKQQRLKHGLALKVREAEKLRQLDEMKSHFFSNISHEFKTPLTLIQSPLHGLLTSVTDPNQKRIFTGMLQNCRRLLELINQVLMLARLEAGKMPVQAVAINLKHFLHECLEPWAHVCAEKGIHFAINLPEIEPAAAMDQDKLGKILSNLLSNAAKFTPTGGRVEVTVEYEGGGDDETLKQAMAARPSGEKAHLSSSARPLVLQISVRDSGAGFSGEERDRIFERFYQAPHHRSEYGGSGIGLALVKELVDLQGGSIEVESKPGLGTCFIVRLPLLQLDAGIDGKERSCLEPSALRELPSASSSRHTVEDRTSSADKGPPLLLIVEDHSETRAFIIECLARKYRLISTEAGAEGLQMALEQMPDLIISDVLMPGIDGFAFCRKVKTDVRTSHTPVILLTAAGADASKISGLEHGADYYLTKPFNPAELELLIDNLFARQAKQREHFRQQALLMPKTVEGLSLDEVFLQRLTGVVDDALSDSDFSVEECALRVGMSRQHLDRKLQALRAETPSEFIRNRRLERAAELLEAGAGSVTEICFMVGYENLSTFSKRFRERFGENPSVYRAGGNNQKGMA